MKRFVSIWFMHLLCDRHVLRNPELKGKPFVLASPERGRMVAQASSPAAQRLGITPGMVVADARAAFPSLTVVEDKPGLGPKLLAALAEWAIRYTPIVSLDLPDGLILDATGCAHLWGGETRYLQDIVDRLASLGYEVRVSIADTIGTTWAMTRFGEEPIVESGTCRQALLPLPPAALRLEQQVLEKMYKLGLDRIQSFIEMPRSVLRRRFGQGVLGRLDRALGYAHENITPIVPINPYQERLPCMEPIRTATGIGIAVQRLLEMLCGRLAGENKGLRKAILKAFRLDGNLQQIEIGTSGASCHIPHLYKLFELKFVQIEPDLGIELFVLEAPVVEDLPHVQHTLWNLTGSGNQAVVAELLDRLIGRGGPSIIHRYLPAEHHWPEFSIKEARSLEEKSDTDWPSERLRPVHLLTLPERIDVTAPQPDYPPILFRHKGKVVKVKKADGPERIEQEWWLTTGEYRDYYVLEDEQGARYWVFRLGHYSEIIPHWYLHGFFA